MEKHYTVATLQPRSNSLLRRKRYPLYFYFEVKNYTEQSMAKFFKIKNKHTFKINNHNQNCPYVRHRNLC